MSLFCDFYDENWRRLQKRDWLVARKLEDLRCEAVSVDEFDDLRRRVAKIEEKLDKLLEIFRDIPIVRLEKEVKKGGS